MKELNEEIKQTLNLMQSDIDDGLREVMQKHLTGLLEIKRTRLVAETELQAELERERERRFDGNRIASAEHRDELECLVGALEKIADFKLLSNDGATEFSISQDRWRKFCEAQGVAADAIAQYRKEPVTHDQAPYKSVKLDLQFGDPDKPLTADEYMAGGWCRADISEDALKAFIFDGDKAKPLTTEELKAGDWLCTDVSRECANALKSKNLRVFNSDEWGDDGLWVGCVMDACGDVKRKGIFFDFVGKKQIHRVGSEFYWS